MLDECVLETVLAKPRDQLCEAVLELCRPQMPPEPTGGWLPWIYHWLTLGIYPDPAEQPDKDLAEGAEYYVRVLERALEQERAPFDWMTDLLPVPENAAQSRVTEEYERFQLLVRRIHLMALLRIGRACMPFDTASHIIGVHNVALHTGILAAKAGLPVDLLLLSAASFAHDVGKFGCRGAAARRIPYLHYYYTWTWLEGAGLDEIGHVAANHSTWDLEFENLPMESLLLIYADFRVRGHRGTDGREIMEILTLEQSRDVIFSKLADMTPEKQRRYRSVYAKLRDFEEMLRAHGISGELTQLQPTPQQQKNPALLNSEEAMQALRRMTFENTIALMHTITTDHSFDQLLEQARGERTTASIRTYLRLLQEYSTYMSRANKQKVLKFLYELLMNFEGDVRRRAAQIMGEILANSGPSYRKELPADAPKNIPAPAMMDILDQTAEIWDDYVEQCLHPDRRIAPNHANRISNSLKAITESLFARCEPAEYAAMAQPLLKRLDLEGEDRFVLAETLCQVPLAALGSEDIPRLRDMIADMLMGPVHHRIASLKLLEHLQPRLQLTDPAIRQALKRAGEDPEFAVAYLAQRLRGGCAPEMQVDTAQVYLSNLKNAVHWTVKLIQIDALCDDAARHPENVFHTATHLSNLLSVSEHLPVRQYAGQGLLRIAGQLTVDQRNEIVVDLLRELENGRDQVSRFIPPYLGGLLCMLPRKEFDEGLDYLQDMIHTGVERSARAAGYTLGVVINTVRDDPTITDRALGILATGIAHYKDTIHQTALTALCRDVFSSGQLPLQARRKLFRRIHKKLLCLLSEPRNNQLTAFNRAAMLNHLYRFMVQCEVELGEFPQLPLLPAAFFPGTFDPFSVGHKRIVEEIRAMGFEVYLAVDEFSWSKRTLAKLQRRKIVSMSVASLWDVYLFPDEIPVNIAMPEDLAALKTLFPGRELYLVAGSDVIRNASAYRSDQPGSAADYNHVVFNREEMERPDMQPLSEIIRGKLQVLSLPSYYETVSSTRIREYVDQNLDISMLVHPVVQSYIYEYGLYLRTPQFKKLLKPEELYYRRYTQADMPADLRFYLTGREPCAVGLYTRREERLLGWACGHTASASELYEVVGDLEATSFVRRHTSGRILVVDHIHCEKKDTEIYRRLINELLARSLPQANTYGLCRVKPEQPLLLEALKQTGFVPLPRREDLFYVDMRDPMVLIQDVNLVIKTPLRDDPQVKQVVERCRPRLRHALTAMFPGCLVLSFDAEMLNQALLYKVEAHNRVLDVPAGVRHLGKQMCVPYGKILSDMVVPNTVTKTLHVEKVYSKDISTFTVGEYPGYSSLANQIRTIKSFRRPVLLVDDLLHKGYRIDNLDPLFRAEDVDISCILVGIMSGRGNDLMQLQQRNVDCEYFVPNLHYWFTESGLYPFLGGDSVESSGPVEQMLPSINMILPYYYPKYIYDASPEGVRRLSETALENACEVLEVLERRHQQTFNTVLTLRRLGEAVYRPRLPDKGQRMQYDLSVPASAYVRDDLALLNRTRTE